jgi:hypothetical protein
MQLAGPDAMIDGYEQYNHHNESDVVNITPEGTPEEQQEPPVRANDSTWNVGHPAECLLTTIFS